ncbi:hypothetical protein [Qipengyuania sphaerica]|uniref:hypothetical protein n=1 Tax=Qipengyuania sphaerica TaxID=2867243 RepID=UPI001C88318E|nr:hypothetical protein [Qipengyuania sphaerica]MBX7541280.1 hypothetical protein [Qipengyuania sphaerica]
MRRGIFLLAIAALSACSHAVGGTPVTRNGIACDFSGPGNGDETCTMFVDAAAGAGREDIVRIEIHALSQTSARVRAFDAAGGAVAQLDFDVMDTVLGPQTWQDFADAFAELLDEATA